MHHRRMPSQVLYLQICDNRHVLILLYLLNKPANPSIAIECIHNSYIISIQLKVKNVKVVSNSLLVDWLWNWDNSWLDKIPQDNLSWRFIIFCCDSFNFWVFCKNRICRFSPWSIGGTQRTVGCNDDVFWFAERDKFLLVEIGMTFNLKYVLD